MPCRRGRVLKPEILDTLPPEQARRSLGDLVRLNRTWGGYSTLRHMVAEIPAGPFTLLDVGAASGDMGAVVRKERPEARVTSLDYIATHLAAAPHPKVAGDAFALPFATESFDYVFCSLFLHHFTNAQIVDLLAEFGRVARRGVMVIDLERNPIAYYFVPWTRWIFGWDRVTCNDAPISVEAAFTERELAELARVAGLKNIRTHTYRPAFRIALMGSKV